MKITTLVQRDDEIEVDVSVEDITNALCAATDRPFAVSMGLNNIAQFMRAIPDSIIAEMKDGHRQKVREFLIAQTARF